LDESLSAAGPRQVLAQPPRAAATSSASEAEAMRFEHEPVWEDRVMAELLLRSWRLDAEVNGYRPSVNSLEIRGSALRIRRHETAGERRASRFGSGLAGKSCGAPVAPRCERGMQSSSRERESTAPAMETSTGSARFFSNRACAVAFAQRGLAGAGPCAREGRQPFQLLHAHAQMQPACMPRTGA